MNVGELKQALRSIKDDVDIVLINYFDKTKDYGELECLEQIDKITNTVTFRVKPEVRYC